MIRVHRASWAVLALAFAACDPGPTAVPATADAADGLAPVVAQAAPDVHMVPFRLSGTWWYAADGDASVCDAVPGTALILFFAWEGTATHLGAVTGTDTNCYGEGPPFAQPILLKSGTITAANGDLLSSYGQAPPSTVFPDLSFEIGPVPFTGGTGRFEYATGWYLLEGADVAGGAFTMTGEISSVGSNKR